MIGCLRRFSIVLASLLAGLGLPGCGTSPQRESGPEKVAVHTYQIDGLTVRTGDLICTNTTEEDFGFRGLFYRLYGILIPGAVDHVVVYVGPGGRCVEAGARFCVATFMIEGNIWDPSRMTAERGPIQDQLYGVAYPLAGLALSDDEETRIREAVASYCLRQADAGKLYNVMFLDSMTEDAFYCSQLAYRAYLEQGIDLNTGQGVPQFPGMESIIFPQEIWDGCPHEQPPGRSR